MKILILGGGFENKGAEAMLRTVQAELARRLEGAAFRAEVKAREGRAAAAAGLDPEWVDDVSAVVDVSGFAYGDDWGEEPAKKAWLLVNHFEGSGRPYVFLPQAWGPFDDAAVAGYVQMSCRKASAVHARDEESKAYLDDLLRHEAVEVHLAPDVAFRFRAAPPEVGARLIEEAGLRPGERPLVGIAPNKHLYQRTGGDGGENAYIRAVVQIVRRLWQKGAAVVLVPHRTFLDGLRPEDDRYLCRLIAEAVGNGGPLGSLMGLYSAEATKSVITHLDLLVGSRYHGIVAAFSSRVPAVILSWSHKYVALARLVGLEKYVVDYRSLDVPALLELVDEAYDTRRAAREALQERLPDVETRVDAVFDRVAELVPSNGHDARTRPQAAAAGGAMRVPGPDEAIAAVHEKTIDAVVDAGLCVGCGMCVRTCEAEALEMVETTGGLLRPRIDAGRCTSCGACVKVCPGWHLEPGLLPRDADPLAGRVLAAYCARASDDAVLADAQSGGAVTALVCHLLDTGRIDRTLVTEMPEDGSLRARPFLADDGEGVRRARGSKYCPVAACAALPGGLGNGAGRIAVVGIGCHIHGLCNAVAHQPAWATSVALRVGLFCDRVLAFSAIDHLVLKAGLPIADAIGFEYRSKRWRGWPGDVRIVTRGGEDKFLEKEHRMACKDQFTPARCRLCFDKFNVLSDIAVGDGWGVDEDPRGASVVLARTERGLEALESAEHAGALRLEPVPPESVFTAQRLEKRRLQWTAYTAAWKQIGGVAPAFSIDTRYASPVEGTDLAPLRRDLRRAVSLSV